MISFAAAGLMFSLLLLWFLRMISSVVDGYENETGFHFGDEQVGCDKNRARSQARRLTPTALGDSCSPDRVAF